MLLHMADYVSRFVNIGDPDGAKWDAALMRKDEVYARSLIRELNARRHGTLSVVVLDDPSGAA